MLPSQLPCRRLEASPPGLDGGADQFPVGESGGMPEGASPCSESRRRWHVEPWMAKTQPSSSAWSPGWAERTSGDGAWARPDPRKTRPAVFGQAYSCGKTAIRVGSCLSFSTPFHIRVGSCLSFSTPCIAGSGAAKVSSRGEDTPNARRVFAVPRAYLSWSACCRSSEPVPALGHRHKNSRRNRSCRQGPWAGYRVSQR